MTAHTQVNPAISTAKTANKPQTLSDWTADNSHPYTSQYKTATYHSSYATISAVSRISYSYEGCIAWNVIYSTADSEW